MMLSMPCFLTFRASIREMEPLVGGIWFERGEEVQFGS